MSYALAASLQEAVFDRLARNATLIELVGDAIFDGAPGGAVPPLYVSLGPEEVRDLSDKMHRGAIHDFVVSIVTDNAGFQSAKQAAGAASDALLAGDLNLRQGRLVSIDFLRAQARRLRDGTTRRIDLRFRARVEE